MKGYIHNCVTTSVLNSFNTGLLFNLNDENGRELVRPENFNLIPPSLSRRMNKMTEMAICTSLQTKGTEEVSGIIVGTGIGCIESILKFLKGCIGAEGGLNSPGVFVQSTHNSIAGQIALTLKNYAYNITYTHRGLSFENALVDAILLSKEESSTILVGGVDEKVDLLDFFAKEKTYSENLWLGEGSSFFLLNQKKENALAGIVCFEQLFRNKESLDDVVKNFLKRNDLETPEILLYGNSFFNCEHSFSKLNDIPVFNYSDISGIYYTNSAFGLQLATEILSRPILAEQKALKATKILLINNFNDKDLSLIYLSSVNN